MLKGNISITRPCSYDGKEYISVQIECEESHTRFIDLEIGYKEFAQALTGLSSVPVEFKVRNLESVGKRKVITRRKVKLPTSLQCYSPDKVKVAEWLKDMYEDTVTYVDVYLGSQSTFVQDEEGDTCVNFSTYVYEELQDE